MARQYQIPGGPVVGETGTRQYQIPGGSVINETVQQESAGVVEPGVGVIVAAGFDPSLSETLHKTVFPEIGSIVIDGRSPSLESRPNTWAWTKLSGSYSEGDSRAGPNLTQGWWKSTPMDEGRVFLSEGLPTTANFGTFIFNRTTGEWTRTNTNTTDFWKNIGMAENYGMCYDPVRDLVYKSTGGPNAWGVGDESPQYGDIVYDPTVDEFFTKYPVGTVTYRPVTEDEIAHWDINGLGDNLGGANAALGYCDDAIYLVGALTVASQVLRKRDLTTGEATTLNSYPNMPPVTLSSRIPELRGGVNATEGYAWQLADDCEFYIRDLADAPGTAWTHVTTSGNKPIAPHPEDGSSGTDWGIIAQINEDTQQLVAWCGIAALVSTSGMTTLRQTWILDLAVSPPQWHYGPSLADGDTVPTAAVAVRQDIVYDPTNKVILLIVGYANVAEVWEFSGDFVELTTKYRPTSDLSAGGWTPSTGSDLFAMVDEVTPDNSDFIQSSVNPSADACELAFTITAPPDVDTNHKLSYIIKGDGDVPIVIALKQGATTIKSWTHDPAPASETLYEQTLSEAEAATITDYPSLKLVIVAN